MGGFSIRGKGLILARALVAHLRELDTLRRSIQPGVVREEALCDQKVRMTQKGLPGPPKDPKIMAQYPKIGSIGAMILAILEVQVRRTKDN